MEKKEEKIATKKTTLTHIDKEILKFLLTPDNKDSSLVLSNKLGIPLTTIQRRRKRLEEEFLQTNHTINLDKLGWRRVDFLISTIHGKTRIISDQLLKLDEVTYVGRSIGQHTIDLRAEVIIKDNAELLDLLEKVKAIDGVQDTIWSEIVEVMGRKRSIPSGIIDKF